MADREDETDDLAAPPQHDTLLRRVARVVATPSATLEPGRAIGARYRIVKPLGAGGMGEVYLARDLTLERDVAIKLHHAGHSVERLRREAIAMARLAHPNVVTVFEVGELAGRAYVAMEYVPGTTLRGWLADRQRRPREILAMLRMIGHGLAAAHDAELCIAISSPITCWSGATAAPASVTSGSRARRVRARSTTPNRLARARRRVDRRWHRDGHAGVHGARTSPWRGSRCARRSVRVLCRRVGGAVRRATDRRHRGDVRPRATGARARACCRAGRAPRDDARLARRALRS
ncbi:MAG: protein kinase [Kofleriaceae bacterium]